MNPSTLIGIVAAVLLLGVVTLSTTQDPRLFVDLPGLGIVVLGTLAATFISYPLREVLRVFGLIGTVLHIQRLRPSRRSRRTAQGLKARPVRRHPQPQRRCRVLRSLSRATPPLRCRRVAALRCRRVRPRPCSMRPPRASPKAKAGSSPIWT